MKLVILEMVEEQQEIWGAGWDFSRGCRPLASEMPLAGIPLAWNSSDSSTFPSFSTRAVTSSTHRISSSENPITVIALLGSKQKSEVELWCQSNASLLKARAWAQGMAEEPKPAPSWAPTCTDLKLEASSMPSTLDTSRFR